MARHGPHHGAQKSISTGCSDWKTMSSNSLSLTSRTSRLILDPPIYRYMSIYHKSQIQGTDDKRRETLARMVRASWTYGDDGFSTMNLSRVSSAFCHFC